MLKFLKPKPTISDKDLSQGLRWLALEGGASQGFFSITTSGFLAAYALALGANNLQIGILAAIPFIMQIVQIPSIWLVEKIRRRKAIAVLSWFPAQMLWIPMALIPYFMDIPGRGAISLLLLLISCRGLLSAVCSTALNSWIRDLVPQTILGRFFSRRLILATTMGMVFSLGAAFFVDYWESITTGADVIHGYIYVLLFGAVFLGLASPVFMSFMPEPLMQPPPSPQPTLEQRLTAPVRDRNFRRLLQFLVTWSFTANLAIPFFAVYMLVRLGFPLSLVIGFSILSQLFNIIFLRIWGRYVDRFGCKVILSICASLYLLVIFGWIFTTMPEQYFLTIPLLVVLHIFAGISNAGVTLSVATIGLKLAPKGETTSYLAAASLATNIGAGLGPLCGGLLADFFAARQLNLTFSWVSPDALVQFPALSIIGYDFLFGIAFILGVITLVMLTAIREEGEATREVVLESLLYPARQAPRQVSSAPSSIFNSFPFGYLKRIPLPGLDAVLGITAYQVAEMARAAASAAIRGQKLTRQLTSALDKMFPHILLDKEVLDEHAVEISREVARGAMHVVDKKPLPVEKVVRPVTSGVVKVASKAGIDPMNGLLGASKGVIQGASETGMDLSKATIQTLKAAKEIAMRTGIPPEEAIVKAGQGALEAAERLGPVAAAEVAEVLPEEVFQEQEKKKDKKEK